MGGHSWAVRWCSSVFWLLGLALWGMAIGCSCCVFLWCVLTLGFLWVGVSHVVGCWWGVVLSVGLLLCTTSLVLLELFWSCFWSRGGCLALSRGWVLFFWQFRSASVLLSVSLDV